MKQLELAQEIASLEFQPSGWDRMIKAVVETATRQGWLTGLAEAGCKSPNSRRNLR